MLKFTENFSMTFAENRTYGVPEFAGTEVNRHSGKLKGLSGYLQNHHDTMVGDKTQQTDYLSSDPSSSVPCGTNPLLAARNIMNSVTSC